MPLPESLNRIRRRSAQWTDQALAKARRRIAGGQLSVPWDEHATFALLTVNYNTTRYLKLMLLTLTEQQGLERVRNIVIADNHSRDGGRPFLRSLAGAIPRVTLVERRRWLHHAPAMRAAIAALDEQDQARPAPERARLLLHVDPDVLFLDPTTLDALATCFDDPAVAFAGELRHHLYPLPEAQASFLAVRRDWAARRQISPWVHHGSPAWHLQRDCSRAGGKGADFRGYATGRLLHRGRSAVATARAQRPWSAYATAKKTSAHYMGVKGGEATWKRAEARLSDWLAPDREDALVTHLARALRF